VTLVKVRELGGFIRDQRNSARLSLRKLSSLTGVSNPYLSQIERGLRRPSADILQAIAKALRISAETLYVQAGILDERSDADPVGEIRRDNTITDRQKQFLIDLYQSFREGDDTKAKPAAATPSKAAAKRAPSRKRVAAARKGKAKAVTKTRARTTTRPKKKAR
jgi:transcriptional regulator with XRE-family HTH domain